MRFAKLSEWLRTSLRRVYRLPADPLGSDFITTVQKEAVDTNSAAASANEQTSRGVSEAVRQTLEAMGAHRNEKH